MSCQNDPEIRRCANEMIDFAFYDARARRLRGEAVLQFPSRIQALQANGSTSAIDQSWLTKATR